MNITFPFIYAFRCLGFGSQNSRSNARKTLIGAVFGIGLSLVPLILVLVVSNGMIAGITRRMVELNYGHIKFIKPEVSADENDGSNEKALKEKLINKYAKDPYFKNAWVERSGKGLIIGKNGRSGGSIRAIEKDFFEENTSAKHLLKITDGSVKIENDNEVLLGKKLAENLGLGVGETCRILTLKTLPNGKTVPKFSFFEVKGIISCGYQELDALWVFIALEKGLEILQGGSSLTSVIVSTEDPFDEKNFSYLFNKIVSGLDDNFVAYSWKNLNRTQYASFVTTKNLLMFIMFLILLVASINISSALIMLVLERNSEIAILKSTGASQQMITFSFFIAGVLTSFFGVMLGLPIGILLAININSILIFIEKTINQILIFVYKIFNINSAMLEFKILDPSYYLENIPVKLNFNELMLIIVLAILLSAVVSIVPSAKAGKERPLDIMRKI